MTEKVIGHVSYEVRTKCPHCKKNINLCEYPYADEGRLEPAEDELGAELFGTITTPAQWTKLDITYQCCFCDQEFTLTNLEI